MTDAQNYYDGLIAQGYAHAEALGFTQQYYPDYTGPAPAAAAPAMATPAYDPTAQMVATQAPQTQPMLGGQVGMENTMPPGGMMPQAGGGGPGTGDWVSIGLLVGMMILAIAALNMNTWRTASYDDTITEGVMEADVEFSMDFGLSSGDMNMEFDCTAEAEGWGCEDEKISESDDYDCDSGDDECEEAETAGLIGKIGLWLAVVLALGSIVLILLNAYGKYPSGLGKMLPFVAGGLAILSCILWLVMFPDLSDMESDLDLELDLGYGLAFFMAIGSGLIGLGAGAASKFMDD